MNLYNLALAIDNNVLETPEVGGIFIDSMKNKNPVYVVEHKDVKLQFINSSNQRTLSDFDSILEAISEKLGMGEAEGEVSDYMSGNEIFFEVVDIDSNGSLL
jgi:hypothetical protein